VNISATHLLQSGKILLGIREEFEVARTSLIQEEDDLAQLAQFPEDTRGVLMWNGILT
jgi:hypothetical protein